MRLHLTCSNLESAGLLTWVLLVLLCFLLHYAVPQLSVNIVERAHFDKASMDVRNVALSSSS